MRLGYTKIVQYARKYEILRYVNICRYLLIVVVVKYSLVKIQDGGNRKRKCSKSGSLSLLWLGWPVASMTWCVCVCVCVCFSALTEKRLELLIPSSVHIYHIEWARHALTLRSKGQRSRSHGYQWAAGVGMHVDTTAEVSSYCALPLIYI